MFVYVKHVHVIYIKFPDGTEVKPFSLRLQPHGHTFKNNNNNTDLIPPATAWLRGRPVTVLQVTPTPAKATF